MMFVWWLSRWNIKPKKLKNLKDYSYSILHCTEIQGQEIVNSSYEMRLSVNRNIAPDDRRVILTAFLSNIDGGHSSWLQALYSTLIMYSLMSWLSVLSLKGVLLWKYILWESTMLFLLESWLWKVCSLCSYSWLLQCIWTLTSVNVQKKASSAVVFYCTHPVAVCAEVKDDDGEFSQLTTNNFLICTFGYS